MKFTHKTFYVVLELIDGKNRMFSQHENLKDAQKEASELNSKVLSGTGFVATEAIYTQGFEVFTPPKYSGTIIRY